jgi:hypothetical protein
MEKPYIDLVPTLPGAYLRSTNRRSRSSAVVAETQKGRGSEPVAERSIWPPVPIGQVQRCTLQVGVLADASVLSEHELLSRPLRIALRVMMLHPVISQ